MGREFLAVLFVLTILACGSSRQAGERAPRHFETVSVPRCLALALQDSAVVEKAYLSEAERENSISIARAFRGQVQQLRRCYEKALSCNPSLDAKIEFQWAIKSDGSVADICSVNDTYGVPTSLLGCLSSEISSIRFPPQAGQPFHVRFPLVFQLRH
jgi:hypothetical protein